MAPKTPPLHYIFEACSAALFVSLYAISDLTVPFHFVLMKLYCQRKQWGYAASSFAFLNAILLTFKRHVGLFAFCEINDVSPFLINKWQRGRLLLRRL